MDRAKLLIGGHYEKDLLMTIQYKDMGPFSLFIFNLKHIFSKICFFTIKRRIKDAKKRRY